MNESHEMAIMLSGEKVVEINNQIKDLTRLVKERRLSQAKLLSESLGVDVQQTMKDYYDLVLSCNKALTLSGPYIRVYGIRSSPTSFDVSSSKMIGLGNKDKCTPSPTILKIYDIFGFRHPYFSEIKN